MGLSGGQKRQELGAAAEANLAEEALVVAAAIGAMGRELGGACTLAIVYGDGCAGLGDISPINVVELDPVGRLWRQGEAAVVIDGLGDVASAVVGKVQVLKMRGLVLGHAEAAVGDGQLLRLPAQGSDCLLYTSCLHQPDGAARVLTAGWRNGGLSICELGLGPGYREPGAAARR